MPRSLHVRNVDDKLVMRLKRRAARHGRSTEAEHREILRQALSAEVEPDFATLAAEMRELIRGRKFHPRRSFNEKDAMRGEQSSTSMRVWRLNG